jgi:hypothetical protein
MMIWACLVTDLLLQAITIVERVLQTSGGTIVERFILRLTVDDTLRRARDTINRSNRDEVSGIHRIQDDWNTAAMMLMLWPIKTEFHQHLT